MTAIPVGAKDWRGITPLRSTRADVELLFGRSSIVDGSWAVYQTKEEAISVLFASGPPCGSNADNEWRVPRGTVISMTISPKTRVLLSTLNIDESKYQKIHDPHDLNRIEYRDKEKGESISVVDDEISSFRYFAASEDFILHCSGSSTRERDMAVAHYFRLDAYGNLLYRDEKIRLDNFAIALQQRLDSKGYIIAYPGSGASLSKALTRLNRARSYLGNFRGIEANRLVGLRGGLRKYFTVELFIVPKEAEAPSPIPQDPRNNQLR